jgi:aryl-alcohol dehydrogenase-like predicted oxidoreductase
MKYKLFGKTGLRVSEICLGTMTFGTEWGWGAEYEESKKIFEQYAKAGGNFIDTANRYTEGTSEKWTGDFIRPDRDHWVLATKYTLMDKKGDPNFCGNHRKNLIRSVEGSLKRLKTDYIDLLWLHMWDFTTPVEEVLRGLNDLISNGKVLYIGISDTPAWIVSKANAIAEERGWHRFEGLQIEYSLIERTVERELLPMAEDFGMTVTPWAPLAGGLLSGKYLKNRKAGRIQEGSIRLSKRNVKISEAVVEVAEKIGTTPSQVAMKWIMQNHPKMVPIVGARKTEQIIDSLHSLEIEIPSKQMEKLEEASKVELGFPHEFYSKEPIKDIIYGGTQNDIVF